MLSSNSMTFVSKVQRQPQHISGQARRTEGNLIQALENYTDPSKIKGKQVASPLRIVLKKIGNRSIIRVLVAEFAGVRIPSRHSNVQCALLLTQDQSKRLDAGSGPRDVESRLCRTCLLQNRLRRYETQGVDEAKATPVVQQRNTGDRIQRSMPPLVATVLFFQ